MLMMKFFDDQVVSVVVVVVVAVVVAAAAAAAVVVVLYLIHYLHCYYHSSLHLMSGNLLKQLKHQNYLVLDPMNHEQDFHILSHHFEIPSIKLTSHSYLKDQ